MEICKQQSELEMRHLPASQYMVMWAVERFKRYGLRVGVANFFWDQSIGIDGTNTF